MIYAKLKRDEHWMELDDGGQDVGLVAAAKEFVRRTADNYPSGTRFDVEVRRETGPVYDVAIEKRITFETVAARGGM